ncbi:MAG: PAS domain S-box protein, partial [Bacteroidota bacterium]
MKSPVNGHIKQNINYQTGILDSMAEPVSLIDKNYIYLFVNKAFVDFYNIEIDEIINKPVGEVLGEENFREKIKPNLDKCLQGNHVEWQYDTSTPSGEPKVMEINSNPHHNDSNEIDGIICSTKEIHSPKKLQPKENEILLNETGKLAKVGGWSLDIETNTVTWTKQIYRIADVQEDFEPTLEKSISFFSPNSENKIRRLIYEAIHEGKPFDKELEIITAKSKKIPVRVLGRIETDKNKKPIKIYGAIQDITEPKKAEQALKESEEKFKMLVQNQGEGIGITDENEVFKFANPAAAKIFGVEDSGLINKSLKSFLSPETYEFIKNQTAKRKKKQKGGYEIDIIQPTGKIVTILVTVNPQLDENGEFLGSFGVFRDITERKKAEKALRENEKKLRELNATKDKLFSIIGHDLRSPMSTILGFSEMIEKKYKQYS